MYTRADLMAGAYGSDYARTVVAETMPTREMKPQVVEGVPGPLAVTCDAYTAIGDARRGSAHLHTLEHR